MVIAFSDVSDNFLSISEGCNIGPQGLELNFSLRAQTDTFTPGVDRGGRSLFK